MAEPSAPTSLYSAYFAEASPQIYIVPRWSGTPQSDWYPRAMRTVETHPSAGLAILAMPDWNTPIIEASVHALRQMLPPEALHKDVYLVGHSIGCQALLHYLESIAHTHPHTRIGGLLCVAAWFEVDRHWDTIAPWLSAKIDYASISPLCREITVLISDNDPFTADYARNTHLWQTRLHAEVQLFPSMRHFNDEGCVGPIEHLLQWITRKA